MAFFCINCKSETSPAYKACPFCGEPITDFLRRYLEEPFDGKYKIVSRLGVGGMGEVYKVLHLHLNSLRVVKLMRASVSADQSASERFIREARLATRINHPNVSTLFDFATLADGTNYMVWEYIEGMTLGELLRVRGALPPRYAVEIAIQALAGLEAIHRSGVVHRDVSPENIMITHDDEGAERVKIIDLGIAKQSSESTDSHTKTGMFVGKWKYCSPEQLGMLKEGETIDRRADLYSFGIVLYEMLAGGAPFIADSPHRYLLMHATQTPRPLSELRPELGKASELEAIVFRALEKERDRRFATARQFAAALEAVRSQLGDASDSVEPVKSEPDEETIEQSLLASSASPNRGVDPLESEPTVSHVKPRFADSTVAAETLVGAASLADLEAATVVQAQPVLDESSRTVMETAPPTVGDPYAAAVSPPENPRTGVEPRRGRFIALMALIALVVAAAAFFLLRKPLAPPEPVVQPVVKVPEPHSIPPAATAATASLAVNSVPWSEVTSMRDVRSGAARTLDGVVTPARVEVAPGTWDVTLRRPGGETVTRRIVVPESGSELDVQFEESAQALPSFGGEQ